MIWLLLVAVILVPLVAAASSPLLAWRQPVYIAAGFAGVIAMALLLVQPLLVGGYLPGLAAQLGRRVHRWTGAALVAAITVHVVGLWITSPPDMADALLFSSPTPFSAWGVVAMWAAIGAALLAAFRARFRRKLRLWRRGHTALVSVAVIGSVGHAMMVEGTMEISSKTVLCACALAATFKVVANLRAWVTRPKSGP